MTTRRGVIAALLASVAGLRAAFRQFPVGDVKVEVAFIRIEIPDPEMGTYNGYALEVLYKDRVVRLTADEIMDALEGDEK